jgi:hypothetical protein
MRSFATIFLTFLLHQCISQTVFTVDNFSKTYYGKILIQDTSEVDSKGWIAIYERKTNKQIIKVMSDDLFLELHEGKAVANIRSLPYGEQSLIMYDDFNFDGRKDFAISDGQNSCYHGPSFKIYLASENGFIYSKDFTRLAQEYCGMFDVHPAQKRIFTMTKSGCCWHEYSEFMVKNNKPKLIIRETEKVDLPYSTSTLETWNADKKTTKSIQTIDTSQEGIKVILSFSIPDNNKQIILFNINDRTLNYALVKKDSSVEFSYPGKTEYKQRDFVFDSTLNNLSVTFKNTKVEYKIYETQNSVGIIINVDGKSHDWIGNLNTKTGSLSKLREIRLDNVY